MNTENIIIALKIMAYGMTGIFSAILIIMIFVWFMGRFGNGHFKED